MMSDFRFRFFCFCGGVILLLLSGCFHIAADFEQKEVFSRYVPYRFPVKFYVRKINMVNVAADPRIKMPRSPGEKFFLEKPETEKLRSDLVRYFPEIFVSDPRDALEVEFTFSYPLANTRSSAFAPVSILLSLFSCGIFPVVNRMSTEVFLRAEIGKISTEQRIVLLREARGNLGILGLLLPTYRLIPAELKDPMLETSAVSGAYGFTFLPGKSPEFLKLFIAVLYSIPAHEVQELYLSSKKEKTVWME